MARKVNEKKMRLYNIMQRILSKEEKFNLLSTISFMLIAILLTWPIILRPGNIHFANPWGINQIEFYMDQLEHLSAVKLASIRLLNGDYVLDVRPGYALPQNYIVLGAVLTAYSSLSTIEFFNLFFIFSMFLAGLGQFLFVKEILNNRKVAFLAGVLFMSSFYLFYCLNRGYTNQWQIQWIPLVFYGVEKVQKSSSPRYIGFLGMILALQVISSEQYSAYLSFFVPLYIMLRYATGVEDWKWDLGIKRIKGGEWNWEKVRQNATLQFFFRSLIAVFIAVILSAPYLLARFSIMGTTPKRSIEENAASYWVFDTPESLFFAGGADFQFAFRLFLLIWGLVFFLTFRRRVQKKLIPFIMFIIVALSLGLGAQENWYPYTLLYKYWPLIDYFRVPQRIFPIVAVGTSTISASFLLEFSTVTRSEMSRREIRAVLIVLYITSLQMFIVHRDLVFSIW